MTYTTADMAAFSQGQVIHGFRVERTGEIPDWNASYAKLIHEASGATLYYADRDDGQLLFSVSFRTIPEDDTGVFHILEHSCLDGSEHFPLREPFVNLLKTSMAVDLNAVTYQDRTVYYFGTTNQQDYMNMMSVYVDAVFYPLLLTDRRIFEKEAWHLEPDGQGGVTCSGVVYNEMQGHENRPGGILWRKAMSQLYPNRYDRFSSGGDPAAIRTLTYEDFCETYRRFYGSDNAVFYLSGKLPMEALTYLDGVLSNRPSFGYAPPAIPPEHPPVQSLDGEAYYQLGENEGLEGNTQLMLSYVLPRSCEDSQLLAWLLLTTYLSENTQSPLTDAVLSSGIGQEFSMDVDLGGLEGVISFTLGKSDPQQAEPFMRIVLDTLKKLSADGLDDRRLRDIMSSRETDRRRRMLRADACFSLMRTFIRGHIQEGDLYLTDELAALRADVDKNPRYFEELIQTYILNNQHVALTRCIPSRTVAAETAAATQAWLSQKAQEISAVEGGMEALISHAEAFNDYLLTEDSPEMVATVPHLKSSDISMPPLRRDVTVDSLSVGQREALSLQYEVDTNGITTAGLMFDVGGLNEDDIFYLRCLKQTLLALPTAHYSVDEMCDAQTRLQTYFDLSFHQFAHGVGENDFSHYLHLQIDTPEDRLSEALPLMEEYLSHAVFDKETLKRLLSSTARFRNRLVSSGNGTALFMAEQCLTYAGAVRWQLTGIPAYRRMTRLSESFDDMVDDLVDGMSRIYRRVMGGVMPVLYHVGSETSYAVWRDGAAKLSLSDGCADKAFVLAPKPLCHQGLVIPGGVNYCAEVLDITSVGGEYSAKLQAITAYLSGSYFWDEIRAKGGAYGGSCLAFPNGLVGLVSYRDPRMADTYEVYDRLPQWLTGHLPDDGALDSLIVSTLGQNYFVPQGPIDEGMASVFCYFKGKTSADRQKYIADIMSLTRQDFLDFAELLTKAKTQGRWARAALGGQEVIARSGLFDTTDTL